MIVNKRSENEFERTTMLFMNIYVFLLVKIEREKTEFYRKMKKIRLIERNLIEIGI